MTTYQREIVSAVMNEIKPMLADHQAEIATWQDIPLMPDYETYLKADALGIVRLFTARRDKLIGYAVFFVGSLHYKTTLQAHGDLIFVIPEYRGKLVGNHLLDYSIARLKAEGMKLIRQPVMHTLDFGPLLVRKGFRPTETIYELRC